MKYFIPAWEFVKEYFMFIAAFASGVDLIWAIHDRDQDMVMVSAFGFAFCLMFALWDVSGEDR